MEKNSEPLSPENANEESNLKSSPKNIAFDESINNKSNLLSDEALNNVNVKLNEMNMVKDAQNISSVSKKTQYKVYLPIVTIKIILPSFFMLKYIIYSYENIEDQNYCKYSVIILTLFILFCYYFSVFSNSSQTKVDKYFNNSIYYSFRSDSPGNEIQNLTNYQ